MDSSKNTAKRAGSLWFLKEQIADASPGAKARMAGVFFLLYTATGTWGYSVTQGLVVSRDAAATAANILANETLFRLAIAANLVSAACYVVVTVLFYDLFKPVDRTVSRLAAFFNLTSCAIGAFDSLFQLAALDVLKGPYLSVFSAQQLQALALLFLKLNVRALDTGQIFFGFQWLTIGYLILRSTFLPRIFGAIAAFSGLWYLTRLYPPLLSALFPFTLIVPAIGVMMLILWLTIKGVDAQRWKEQASRARESLRT